MIKLLLSILKYQPCVLVTYSMWPYILHHVIFSTYISYKSTFFQLYKKPSNIVLSKRSVGVLLLKFLSFRFISPLLCLNIMVLTIFEGEFFFLLTNFSPLITVDTYDLYKKEDMVWLSMRPPSNTFKLQISTGCP